MPAEIFVPYSCNARLDSQTTSNKVSPPDAPSKPGMPFSYSTHLSDLFPPHDLSPPCPRLSHPQPVPSSPDPGGFGLSLASLHRQRPSTCPKPPRLSRSPRAPSRLAMDPYLCLASVIFLVVQIRGGVWSGDHRVYQPCFNQRVPCHLLAGSLPSERAAHEVPAVSTSFRLSYLATSLTSSIRFLAKGSFGTLPRDPVGFVSSKTVTTLTCASVPHQGKPLFGSGQHSRSRILLRVREAFPVGFLHHRGEADAWLVRAPHRRRPASRGRPPLITRPRSTMLVPIRSAYRTPPAFFLSLLGRH